MAVEIVPLPPSFMATSIIGYIVSLLVVYPHWPSFGFAFCLVFMMMFIASVISMTYAPEKEPLMAGHLRKRYLRK